MNTEAQYLKAIYALQQSGDGLVGTGEIAERLDVTPATVNERIGLLVNDGLVEHEKYSGVRLTDAGTERARDAVETYCIIEYFLRDVLEVEEYESEARALSGAVDALVADRLDIIVERDRACPECFDADADRCRYLADSE